jgi:hypothetical protein
MLTELTELDFHGKNRDGGAGLLSAAPLTESDRIEDPDRHEAERIAQ